MNRETNHEERKSSLTPDVLLGEREQVADVAEKIRNVIFELNSEIERVEGAMADEKEGFAQGVAEEVVARASARWGEFLLKDLDAASRNWLDPLIAPAREQLRSLLLAAQSKNWEEVTIRIEAAKSFFLGINRTLETIQTLQHETEAK